MHRAMVMSLLLLALLGCDGEPAAPAGSGTRNNEGQDAEPPAQDASTEATPDAAKRTPDASSTSDGSTPEPKASPDAEINGEADDDAGQTKDATTRVVDAGPLEASCFDGGKSISAISGDGGCGSPLLMDLSNGLIDEVFFYKHAETAQDADPTPLGKCGADTARDIVFNLRLPPETDVEVTLDGAPSSDGLLMVQDEPEQTCRKNTTTRCVDESAAGQCEFILVRSGFDFVGEEPQLIVSERTASSHPLLVRFRLRTPGTGS